MKIEKKGDYVVITEIKVNDLVFSRDGFIRIGKYIVGQYEKLSSSIYGYFTTETFRVRGNVCDTIKEVKEALHDDLKSVNYKLIIKQ